MSNIKRVLVFGSAGVGKTSMINELTGEIHATSSGALGCTFETTYYKPIQIKQYTYSIVDTAGLNEGSCGNVTAKRAISNLIDLVLRNKEGFNLLIMVMKCGRIDQGIERQYELFVRQLADGQVPVILVVSGCENEKTLDAWAKDPINKDAIENRYNMNFCCVVGSCWVKSRNPALESACAPIREESMQKLIYAMEKYALPQPVKIAPNGIMEFVRKMYNFLAGIFKWTLWTSKISQLLIHLGFSAEEAIQVEKTILEEREKVEQSNSVCA